MKRLILLSAFILCLGACQNAYHSETYEVSDTYGEIFEGRLQPYDMRTN